jgi:hypothetical protein
MSFSISNQLIFSAYTGLLLVACSSTGTLYYKDGKITNTVTCNGTSWMDCYKDAGDICKTAGYAILEKHSNKEMGFWGPDYTKEMIFLCNEGLTTSK